MTEPHEPHPDPDAASSAPAQEATRESGSPAAVVTRSGAEKQFVSPFYFSYCPTENTCGFLVLCYHGTHKMRYAFVYGKLHALRVN